MGGHAPCCFLRHMTVKRVAKADIMTRGTVMAMARMGPAHGECTEMEANKELSIGKQELRCLFLTFSIKFLSK